MGICGMGQWMVKQATDKYNNLLTTYREGRRKLDETSGGGLESYRKKYPWWDAMAALLAGNGSVQPEHIFYDGVVTTRASSTTPCISRRGGDQEATPSRHPNEDILQELTDENDDSDGSRSQPPPPSKRLRVNKAAKKDISQVILEIEKHRQNFELDLERMCAKSAWSTKPDKELLKSAAERKTRMTGKVASVTKLSSTTGVDHEARKALSGLSLARLFRTIQAMAMFAAVLDFLDDRRAIRASAFSTAQMLARQQCASTRKQS
ncbi:hypothetical protein PsorP6_007570 [Peronosclerospora sorghi]|uniref:Uncharacterized protein n=1 Tax=Peronosclerospora sorghi TaxID=230839 RepID=A0ACC0WB25_9STRA|nr:hypothetical protein PsorP6_007570 [Peronosclerospora sorghi]